MRLFKHKETPQETMERLLKLTDGEGYSILFMPMNAQVAVNELCHFFLGDDWWIADPVSNEQVDTDIVYEIERAYIKFNHHDNKRRAKHAKS